MDYNVKCAICGAEFQGETYVDTCPVCDWLYTGEEQDMKPDEICEINKITINQAKENYKNGLNIWGNPLK